MEKAYKFRIYPNKNQKVLINKTFGCIRFAWNQWTEQFNKSKISILETPKQLRDKFEWMKEISYSPVRCKFLDFLQFKKQFFNKNRKKKLGKPNFKSKKNKQSFRLAHDRIKINQEINKIRLEKIGWVKVIFDRIIPENVKIINATISKDLVEDLYICITVEQNIEQKPKTGKEVGIDVGLTHFAILSNGEKKENPRFFRENQSEIVRIQRHLARKVKGSRRYEESRRKLAKLYRKVVRQRENFIHEFSSYLVNNFDIIAVETLSIQNMLKNHNLAKSIQDVAWNQLFVQLAYKCRWYGKEFRKSDRFEATSKKCSVCGYKNTELTLAVREWTCPICRTKHDRDINGAVNVLNESKLVGVDAGLQTWRECKTLKTDDLKQFPVKCRENL